MSKSKALIVGCSGRLGSALAQVLPGLFDIDICLRLDISRSSSQFGIIFCSQTKRSYNLDDYEIIINCAWVRGVSSKSLQENILLSELLLNGTRVGAYFYLSTIDVYGNNECDSMECAPQTIFSLNKLKTELAILKKSTLRKKIILRVGNFISLEQLAVDSLSLVFKAYIDRSKKSNLVDLTTLMQQIDLLAKMFFDSEPVIVINCLSHPNRRWGEVIDSVKHFQSENTQVSRVNILRSKGYFPLIFRYIKKNGVVSLGISFVTARVFLKIILSPFLVPPTQSNSFSLDGVELQRVYQDYTLRN